MFASTSGRVPAGTSFMERINAERGIEETESQLSSPDLDTALMDRWQTDGRCRAAGFSLVFLDGSYPEDLLERICELSNVMNTAPRENLEVDDSYVTPDQTQQHEQSMFAAGLERWAAYTVEDSTGAFAGYTEVFLERKPSLCRRAGGRRCRPAIPRQRHGTMAQIRDAGTYPPKSPGSTIRSHYQRLFRCRDDWHQ
jgi:mycothiol synthase